MPFDPINRTPLDYDPPLRNTPMYPRTAQLIEMLHERFDYTIDNTRDLDEPSVATEVFLDELAVMNAYQYIIAHLERADPETDKACWGDYGDED